MIQVASGRRATSSLVTHIGHSVAAKGGNVDFGTRWHPVAHSVNKHAPARRASEKYEKAGTSATLGRMSRFEHTIPSIEVGMDGDEFKPSSIQECGDRELASARFPAGAGRPGGDDWRMPRRRDAADRPDSRASVGESACGAQCFRAPRAKRPAFRRPRYRRVRNDEVNRFSATSPPTSPTGAGMRRSRGPYPRGNAAFRPRRSRQCGEIVVRPSASAVAKKRDHDGAPSPVPRSSTFEEKRSPSEARISTSASRRGGAGRGKRRASTAKSGASQ